MDGMLIPRFSLRWLLGLTTVSALISLVLSFAVRGQPWALGFTAGLWCLVVVFLLYVFAFLAAWLIANTKSAFTSGAQRSASHALGESPFANPLPVQPAHDSPPAMTG
jgi:hypothetical protein